MRFELFITAKYLRSRRKGSTAPLMNFVSIFAVAIGVMALIVVIAVMTGFDEDLTDKIVNTKPHVVIEKPDGIENAQEIRKKVKNIPGVVAVSEFLDEQVVLTAGNLSFFPVLRGVDPVREKEVTEIEKFIVKGGFDLGENKAVVGKELAGKLSVGIGDSIFVHSPLGGPGHNLEVSGIFKSGMYQYDISLVIVSLHEAQEILFAGERVRGVGIRIGDIYRAKEVKQGIQAVLGPEYWVNTWMDLNENFFSALKLEKTVMFIILTLIVVVACFNIISALVTFVVEKTRDIGILKSVGATNGAIGRIFMLTGLTIGLIGTCFGTASGLLLAYVLKEYPVIRLPSDVYYLDRLPVSVQASDIIMIVGVAVLITLCATIYPAIVAARLEVVDALRYE